MLVIVSVFFFLLLLFGVAKISGPVPISSFLPVLPLLQFLQIVPLLRVLPILLLQEKKKRKKISIKLVEWQFRFKGGI